MWLSKQITILNGQTDSPELDLAAMFPASRLSLMIIAPGTLPESVGIRVSPAVGGTYAAVQSAGDDIVLPAGKATSVSPIVAGALKLVAGAGVGDDRLFEIIAAPTK